jgi:hypothetical protein
MEVYRLIKFTEVFNLHAVQKKKNGKFKLIKLIKQFISAPFKNHSKKKCKA